MNTHELKRRFPRASAAFINANASAESAGAATKLECVAGHEPLETHQGQKRAATKLHIRFVSVRKRLCDPDNISVKWALDCLRYCGAIGGDEPEKISLEVKQRKAIKGEEEHTMITIAEVVTI